MTFHCMHYNYIAAKHMYKHIQLHGFLESYLRTLLKNLACSPNIPLDGQRL